MLDDCTNPETIRQLKEHVRIGFDGRWYHAAVALHGEPVRASYAVAHAARALRGVDGVGDKGQAAHKLARRRALAALARKVGIMTGDTAHLYDRLRKLAPKAAAKALWRTADDRATQAALAKIYGLGKHGEPWARDVTRELCRLVTEQHIMPIVAGAYGVQVGNFGDWLKGAVKSVEAPVETAATAVLSAYLGPAAPAIVKAGASILDGALKGDPKAVAKVKKITAAAKAGNPKAKKAARILATVDALKRAKSPTVNPATNKPAKLPPIQIVNILPPPRKAWSPFSTGD